MIIDRCVRFAAWTLMGSLVAGSALAHSPSISGSGQKASPLFVLEEGLTVFKIVHTGKSNFSVWLLDDDGNNVELLTNTIGPFNGSHAVRVPRSGSYLLNVRADGEWRIKAESPKASKKATTKSSSGNRAP